MADEPEPLRDVVRRLIRQELEQGGLDRLLDAHQALAGSFNIAVHPRIGMDAGPPPGAGSFSLSVTPRLSFGPAGPEPVDQVVRPVGIASAEVVAEPTVTAEATLIPAEAVDAIRSGLPTLADEIEARSHRDGMFLLAVFMAFMALLQTAMQAYQLLHPQAPTPPQVVQIFNQIYNAVNPPPPHGAG